MSHSPPYNFSTLRARIQALSVLLTVALREKKLFFNLFYTPAKNEILSSNSFFLYYNSIRDESAALNPVISKNMEVTLIKVKTINKNRTGRARVNLYWIDMDKNILIKSRAKTAKIKVLTHR